MFVVDTDASNPGIGVVLSKVQDGQERVTAYYSKTLNKAERNYCVTRRELPAIVKAESFPWVPLWTTVQPRTDHSALIWLMRFKNLEGQTTCWI
jgi:hypothetical protein